MISFIVALSLFILSFFAIILIFKNSTKESFCESWVSSFFFIIFAGSFIFGLLLIPLTITYKVEYREIINYQFFKASDVIIVDISNSTIKNRGDKLFKYNTYRAVTEFNDSTKIFEGVERGFYGNVLVRFYVWSNPPYTYYNKE